MSDPTLSCHIRPIPTPAVVRHAQWQLFKRRLCAEVPTGTLIYEITGEFRLGRFVWVVSPFPVRVVRVGGWGGILVVASDSNPREERFCLHWARKPPPPITQRSPIPR